MKRKIVKLLAVSMCFAFAVSLAACGTQDTSSGNSAETEGAESSGSEETASDETEDTSGTDDASETEEETETQVMTLDDGTEVNLTALEEGDVGVYGEYICENDGSVWVFGGNNLAVAYTGEDGTVGAYVCSIDFYQTDMDENGEYYLCAVLNNTLKDTSTCWYVMNVIDDDENTTGLVLQDPGDEERYVALTLTSSDDEDADSTADTEGTSDTDSASE